MNDQPSTVSTVAASNANSGSRDWMQSIKGLSHPRAICMLFLGFSAGLPLLLVFGTMSVWLREAGIERSTVTFLSWAALGYSFKFVWAPIVDRMPLPYLTRKLGRRRAWLLVSQFAIVASLLWTSFFNPQTDLLLLTVIGAVCIGFSSATQDIVIDAYRIESAPPDLQAMLSATYIAGYRIGMVVAGAGALWIADFIGGGSYSFKAWSIVYQLMACCMIVGIITTLVNPEPKSGEAAETSFTGTSDYVRFFAVFVLAVTAFASGFILTGGSVQSVKSSLIESWGVNATAARLFVESCRMVFSISLAALTAWILIKIRLVNIQHVHETYVSPVTDFFLRYGRLALVILLLVGTYRISDIVLGIIANVFYLDMGFTKSQIAHYSKFWGLMSAIAGGLLGGVLALRFGVLRTLLLGAILAPASNLLFLALTANPVEGLLLFVVVLDSLSAGIASAAFVSYLSSLTNIRFTAMQFAIFTSIMLLFPKLIAGYSGTIVDGVGYETFFIITTLIGLPVIAVILWVQRLTAVQDKNSCPEVVSENIKG